MIQIEFRNDLRVRGGKLAEPGTRGSEVHAATFLRQRRIVLDTALLKKPRELRRIFFHELFHFVWWRLPNRKRASWEAILLSEQARRARGELGWSAEVRKSRLSHDDSSRRTRAWREYCCESFCDSGASLLHGAFRHSEFTLALKFRKHRHNWLGDIIQSEADLVRIVNPEDCWSGFVWPVGFDGLRTIPFRKRAVTEAVKRPQNRS